MKESERSSNPILELIVNSLSNLKSVVDVDTVVGEPVDMGNGDKIFPLVKITVGYVAGGGEYTNKLSCRCKNFPFAGGSSAGFSAEPIGFLVARKNGCELVTMENEKAFAGIAKNLSEAVTNFVKTKGKEGLEKVKKEVKNPKK